MDRRKFSQNPTSEGVKPAAAIPNLLETLRAGRASRKDPQRSAPPHSRKLHGGLHGSEQEEISKERLDAVVQHTDDDAAGSRMSAVELDYLEDAHAEAFWKSAEVGINTGPARVRRMPIINRGTYAKIYKPAHLKLL